MKKFLLTESGNYYKANLHCHTNISDGRLTPEEIKEAYMARGYSIVAYTDHDILVGHNDLTDDKFLALNGYEMEANETGDKPFDLKKTCHMCFIALEPDNLNQVCYHRTKFKLPGFAPYEDKIIYDKSLPDYERDHSVETVNDMFKKGREGGFFVTYNHPAWSLENYKDYSNFEGMNALEIHNTAGLVNGHNDYCEMVYDDMLRLGKRIFCIAADDNHNKKPFDSRQCDSFGGFTMIKAEKLEYKAITDALLAGNFYCSQGPEIYDLWIEGDFVNITCSDADKIVLHTGVRTTGIRYAENGVMLNKASFSLRDNYGYFRITVTDKNGKVANTNAYFIAEVYKK